MSAASSASRPLTSNEINSSANGTPSPISPLPKVNKKQTVTQLKDGLAQLGLDTKGKKDTLWRRLVNAIHRASLRDPPSEDSDGEVEEIEHESYPTNVAAATAPSSAKTSKQKSIKQPYQSFLCFDVEATCRGGKEFDWPNEIIEFPVVLLRWTEPDSTSKRKLQIVDKFRSYVRPTWQPKLTEFCTTLTGISQETVDAAPTFPQMLKKLEAWMDQWELRKKDGKGLNEALWVTDGPWDLRDFIPKQLHITPPDPMPTYLHGPYLNIKHAVQSVLSETYRRQSYADEHPHDAPNARALSPISTARYGRLNKVDGKMKDSGPNYYFNIPGMLHAMELDKFVGRQHSGLDDATNVARILVALSERNVMFESNAGTQHPGARRYPWMGKAGEVNWEDWMSTNRDKTVTVPVKPPIVESGSNGSTIPAESGSEIGEALPSSEQDRTKCDEQTGDNEVQPIKETNNSDLAAQSRREGQETVPIEKKLANLSLDQDVNLA